MPMPELFAACLRMAKPVGTVKGCLGRDPINPAKNRWVVAAGARTGEAMASVAEIAGHTLDGHGPTAIDTEEQLSGDFLVTITYGEPL